MSTKTLTILLLTFAVMVMPMVSVPTVSARTIKCNMVIEINWWTVKDPDPRYLALYANLPPDWSDNTGDYWWYWKGTVWFPTSQGGVKGTIYWNDYSATTPGKSSNEFYHEWVYIVFDDGSYISGDVKGLFSPVNWKYRADGWITDASANYAYLIGCKFHQEGVITFKTYSPPPLPLGSIVAVGTCFFA
jgi:hypothetical protein